MNPNLSDWDDDLPPEPEEAYQDLLRALKRKSGFGLFFVQCTPGEADKFIVKLPQEIPQKKIAVLRLVEAIDNLYQPVAEFIKDKQIDILLIKGLEYSLYKYEKRNFGEITEGQFSNLTSVPHILNHLNQQRERFRDDFTISFVFLLRSFSINYFIHRAPDFFDWRSGVFELPTTPEVVEQESNRLIDEADYEEYLKLSPEQKIEKVLEIQDLLTEKHQPQSRKANLLFELGRLLDSADEFEAAIASYDQALKFKPDYHYAWYNRGNALRNLGRTEEAIASYDQALKFKPDDHYAWNNRGNALRNLGRTEEAIASYDQALKFKPDYHYAWYNRGYALDNLGRYKEAIASYDQALKFKPDYHYAWYNRGYVLDNLGRYKEAIASYDQALKFKPDDHYAWNNRGYVLGKLGRNEEAIASYDQALKFKPDDHEAWNNRGIALGKLGRNEEAIASYDQALKFKPDYHYAWYERSHILRKLGHYKKAINSFEQAVRNDPDFSKSRIIIVFICKILLIIVKIFPKLINSFKILLKLIILRR
ncbi:tetratricopeptide repeat protein [Nostoc sp. CHAB 5784]|uniref:tetratricopeptide repeat protein n=1 Tax=Nostoc mirabile TaxID=2907820 RepID=UPI001E4CDC2E|nr:tetratricopeptide repeat protein [Nostoc mirabile]MCC5666283.1 tetratricopeptide repeat protein [Nostoc mirabile CHAB5784]